MMSTQGFLGRGFKAVGGFVSLFAANLVFSGTSHALPFGWSEFFPSYTHVATACTVDESDVGSYAYNLGGISVIGLSSPTGLAFKPNSTDTELYAWCNVTNPIDANPGDAGTGNPPWDGLILGYTDPDGTGTAYRVRAYLYRVNRTTGVPGLMGQVDSNNITSAPNYVQNITTWQEGFKPVATFDFFKYEYFVLLQLSRTDTTKTPIITKFRLSNIQKPLT